MSTKTKIQTKTKKSASSETVDLIVNCALHVVILLTILTGVFVFVISKLEQSLFQGEIQNMTGTAVNNFLNGYSDQTSLKNTITNNMTLFNGASNLFSNPDPTTTQNNNWVIGVDCLMICFILLLIIVFVLTVNLVANQRIPLWEIVKQNIYIFLCVGVVEIAFFLFIAQHWLPVMPSFLTKAIVCRARQNFLGAANAGC